MDAQSEPRALASGRKRRQHGNRLTGTARGDEQVIVVVSGDGVHADSFCRKRGRDARQQAHRVEAGVDLECDHPARKGEGHTKFLRLAAPQDERDALLFAEHAHGVPGGLGVGAEDELGIVQDRPKIAQQDVEVAFAGHDTEYDKGYFVKRFPFLDWMRGLAVLIMIQCHTFNSFVRMDVREGGPYVLSQFVGGMAAPLFVFMAGMTLAFQMDSLERREPSAWKRWRVSLRRAAY